MRFVILRSQDARKQFLETESHSIRFLYTPKHCSWLNQIECWFSILVWRRSFRMWASFAPVAALGECIRQFIDSYDDTMSTRPAQFLFGPCEVGCQGRRSRRRETLTRTEVGLSWPGPDGIARPCPMHAGESCYGYRGDGGSFAYTRADGSLRRA